jgi:hypothetical protein
MDLDFSRMSDNEISILLKKEEYVLSVFLRPDCELVYFSCDLGLKVTKKKYVAMTDAIVKANERLLVGHFDLIGGSHIVYSLTIPFVSSFTMDEETAESIIQTIIEECDRFFCYFTLLMTSKTPFDLSIDTLFLDSAGEA